MKGLLQNCCRTQAVNIVAVEVKLKFFKTVHTYCPFPKGLPIVLLML
jgi:hypothetical protein